MTQVFVREFKNRDRGHIINLGSIAGREAYPGGSIYNATKFAVAGFTSALLKELVATQIRVSEVQPGMVETEFSVVRFGGDKEAADKIYKGASYCTLSSNSRCPLTYIGGAPLAARLDRPATFDWSGHS